MDTSDGSRRSFLLSGGAAISAGWLAAHWPAIAGAAADMRGQMDRVAPGEFRRFEFLRPEEAVDVEAITAQVVPSGATPGAREAHAVHFIDHSLVTVFAWRADHFRAGLADFQSGFRALHPTGSFGRSEPSLQRQYLERIEHTEFFATARLLTLIGMFTLPKYGGNYQQLGWKLLGFVDQHFFSPPFGYYDARYTGFHPYDIAGERHS